MIGIQLVCLDLPVSALVRKLGCYMAIVLDRKLFTHSDSNTALNVVPIL